MHADYAFMVPEEAETGMQPSMVMFDDDKMVLKAGVARFKNALDVYSSRKKLVAFSGDLFFPSRMSTMFDGE